MLKLTCSVSGILDAGLYAVRKYYSKEVNSQSLTDQSINWLENKRAANSGNHSKPVGERPVPHLLQELSARLQSVPASLLFGDDAPVAVVIPRAEDA